MVSQELAVLTQSFYVFRIKNPGFNLLMAKIFDSELFKYLNVNNRTHCGHLKKLNNFFLYLFELYLDPVNGEVPTLTNIKYQANPTKALRLGNIRL